MDSLAALTDRLKLLADSTRLRLLSLLRQEELTVSELSAILGIGQSTISSQLGRLREAQMVLDRREGTRCWYRMPKEMLDEVGKLLWEHLEERLRADTLLRADRDRMEEAVLARHSGAWVDKAAGSLDRRYVPGRSYETLALSLCFLLELGDCIDLGSGDGALLDLLAPACRSLTCLDMHPRMLEVGQARAKEAGARPGALRPGDMQEPPIAEASADSVLFLQSLQCAARPAEALKAATALLREGGVAWC